jgi:predicted GNAT family acetyltransferase
VYITDAKASLGAALWTRPDLLPPTRELITMPTDAIDATVTNNAARRRYEAVVDLTGAAGFVEYQETRELVVLTHTEVDPAFEGQGVGSVLARSAIEDIRDRGLKALVVCPFILGWVRRHPDYVDVLYNAPRPRVSEQEGQA